MVLQLSSHFGLDMLRSTSYSNENIAFSNRMKYQRNSIPDSQYTALIKMHSFCKQNQQRLFFFLLENL